MKMILKIPSSNMGCSRKEEEIYRHNSVTRSGYGFSLKKGSRFSSVKGKMITHSEASTPFWTMSK